MGNYKTFSDHCAFVKKFFNKIFIILLLYVDNRLMACDCW